MPAYNGGDAFAVDAWETYAPLVGRGGDAFAADAYVIVEATPTGMATISTDVQTVMAPSEGPMASISVDITLTQAPSPARLKRWDGNQWVPIRMYYYDPVTQAWVMNG